MRMELRDGLTDNSAKKENKNRLFLQPISLLRGRLFHTVAHTGRLCPKGVPFWHQNTTLTERDSRYD